MTNRTLSRSVAIAIVGCAALCVALAAHEASSSPVSGMSGGLAPPVPENPTGGAIAPNTTDDCCGGVAQEPAPPQRGKKRVLRVSADPNNLPFTNDRLEGFENKIAAILAVELDAELQYNWRAQRRGFFRTAFKEGEADLVLGVPVGFDMALTTSPYYRSTYVFVTRRGGVAVTSLDDPALQKLKIGVQMIGDDGANTPPAHALAARGIVNNVVGFTVYGDYREPNPPARVIDAVAKGDIDVAIAWGPMAAYFARRQPVALDVTPVKPSVDPKTKLRFTFAIAVGVKRGNKELRDEIDAALKKRKVDIDKLLDEYGVPRVAVPPAPKRDG